ncbi:MOSC domain-containing protein [Escherichia coli]|uniref:MOSC domain-containing protein n=1 Tax=Escherichia coli TaxID=562 RepID=A0A3S4KJ90_ECOLX|nr:MOSC domain-containing protein [Escherichia coli]
MLTELGLEGDEQAEKKVHGGPDRALCHYPREHYLYWGAGISGTGGVVCCACVWRKISQPTV